MSECYHCVYDSPLGTMHMQARDETLIEFYFEGQKYCPHYNIAESKKLQENDIEVLCQTKAWLDGYFSGEIPYFMPKMLLNGSVFAKEVWEILQSIPYGASMTYGEIAKLLAKRRAQMQTESSVQPLNMSARAIGWAVGRNPIAIIIPCHRVLGAKNNLTGYAGGIDRKLKLLKIEKVDVAGLIIPKVSAQGTIV